MKTLRVTHRDRKLRREDGFTLIELLVVVAIIAVLIAILLPSLGKARDRAKAAVCLSNLKQLGFSYQMYVNDQNVGHNVRSGAAGAGTNWIYVTLAYHNNDYKIYLCPVATTPAPSTFGKNTSGGGWGAKTLAWNGTWNSGAYYKEVNPYNAANGIFTQMDGKPITGKSPGYVGSYTYNSWLWNNSPTSNVPKDLTHFSRLYSDIDNQSSTPLLTDGMWADTNKNNGIQESDRLSLPNCLDGGQSRGQDSADFPPPPGPAPYAANSVNAAWRVFVDRHSQCINVDFADGHAAPVALTNMFTDCAWYNGWQAQPALPSLPPH